MNPTETLDPIVIILLSLILMAIIAVSFLFGIFHERKAWNRLIDEGILPKPIIKAQKLTTESSYDSSDYQDSKPTGQYTDNRKGFNS